MLFDAKDCSKHNVCSQKIVVKRIITTNLSKGSYQKVKSIIYLSSLIKKIRQNTLDHSFLTRTIVETDRKKTTLLFFIYS